MYYRLKLKEEIVCAAAIIILIMDIFQMPITIVTTLQTIITTIIMDVVLH